MYKSDHCEKEEKLLLSFRKLPENYQAAYLSQVQCLVQIIKPETVRPEPLEGYETVSNQKTSDV
jgi:hypothetical protein